MDKATLRKLKFHYETKEIAGYDLVLADKGPKFQKSKDDERRSLIVIPDKKGVPGGTTKYPATFRQVNARRYSLDDFVVFLSGSAGGPVADKTGLSGDYDIDLSWDVELSPSLLPRFKSNLDCVSFHANRTLSFSWLTLWSAPPPTSNPFVPTP